MSIRSQVDMVCYWVFIIAIAVWAIYWIFYFGIKVYTSAKAGKESYNDN